MKAQYVGVERSWEWTKAQPVGNGKENALQSLGKGPVLGKSARGNTFMMSPNLVLKGGHWCHEELPWPWDYDTEAKINPFFAQVWTPLHDLNEMNVYGPEVFDDFKEAIK